ncbi:hypothetical protein WIW50_10355 [Flavobacteriaceae bacterium 3-367]
MKTRIVYFIMIAGLLLLACSKDDSGPAPEPQGQPEQKSGEKQLISFRFTGIENNGIAVDIPAEIDQAAKTIAAEMPPNTDITVLEPEVEVSEKAMYEPIGPQDFSKPINYTVTAEDGTSRTYLVTLEVLLNQKEILLKIVEANPSSTLDWRENDSLSDWEEVILDGEGKVIQLNLGNKRLTVLPPEIGLLTKLQSLEILENSLSRLPPEIGQLTSLVRLDLRENEFATLPMEIGQLLALQELQLGRNLLNELPEEIGQLSNLNQLYLFRNRLSTIPQDIFQLSNLQILNLFGNNLSGVPAEIAQLQNLAFLDLGGNALTAISPEIGLLGQLHSLYLDDNALTTLPDELGQLASLAVLDLRNNELAGLSTKHIPIVNPDPFSISCETNLHTLYLGGNKEPMVLDDCICDLDADNGGTVDIDIVVTEDLNNPNPLVTCQGDVIGN